MVVLVSEGVMKLGPVANTVPEEGLLYQRKVPGPLAFKVTVPGPQVLPSVAVGGAAGATLMVTVGVVWRPQVVMALQLMLAVLLTMMLGVVAPLDQV